MMGGTRARYEVAARTEATIHGGIGLAHRVPTSSGLRVKKQLVRDNGYKNLLI